MTDSKWYRVEKYINNLWHAALIVGAAYVAVNPEYAWVGVALQALGQGVNPPK